MKQIFIIQILFCVSVSGQTATGALRLVNGPGNCAGRVEIFYQNKWGSVCKDFWDTPDAQVVCRQLSCGSALFALGNDFYGWGNGEIWLDDVKCTGHESALGDCRHNGWGNHNCQLTEAAGVICSENLPKPTMSVSNHSDDLELQCILPRIFLNLTVYFVQTNVTKANVTLIQHRHQDFIGSVKFTVSKANQPGAAEYACHYKVDKGQDTFVSPLSEPVCIGILHNPVLCASGAGSSQTVGTSSGLTTEMTTNLPNPIFVADPPPWAEQAPIVPNNTGLVVAVSIVVFFIILLIILAVIFFRYGTKSTSLTEQDIAQANDYIDRDLNGTTLQTVNAKRNLEAKMPPKDETVYEIISDPTTTPTDGLYETSIFYIDTSGTYESLNEATKSKAIYEVLQ